MLLELAEGRLTASWGTPFCTTELRRRGFMVTRKRVAARRRALGLVAKKRRSFRKTTDSNHGQPVAEDRLQRCFAPGPEALDAWLGDITYLTTHSGFVYLATVLCLKTRRLLGYAVASHMRTELVMEAMSMARTQTGHCPAIWHSDRGAQYAADIFGPYLKAHGIAQSMSRKGDCWDNAVAESFFATFKNACADVCGGTHFANLDDAKRHVWDFYNHYNRHRPHSSLGYLTPCSYADILKAA